VPKQEHGSIKIHGEIKDSKLIISIWDNGMGMDEEKCKELLKIRTSKKFHDRFNSIGIANVNERIQIHFGAQYGINIESRKNVYTIVTVTIPVIKNSNPPI
jgi:two-component system sensor histidine kinase YesM